MHESSRILIAEARFYEDVADELAKGAIAVLDEAGKAYERVPVPGVYEIPAAVRYAIKAMELQAAPQGGYSGFIVLGCVIQGETDHYKYINSSAIPKLMDLATHYSIAVGMGIITCENHGQAMERASIDKKNLGGRAAKSCLQMMDVKRTLNLTVR